MSAIIAAHQVGVSIENSCAALGDFSGVMRRMQIIFQRGNFTLYDDFAHHPSAIRETLKAARVRFPGKRIWAVFEPRSNTTRRSIFQNELADSLKKHKKFIFNKKILQEINKEKIFNNYKK